MLSSLHSTYCNTIKGLVAKYIMCGYLNDLVYSWLKNNINIEEQWNKRLQDNKGQCGQVLVLKSEFNTTWNYFNASELGKTILDFWCDWIQHTEDRLYNICFPQYTMDGANLKDLLLQLCSLVMGPDRRSTPLPDIRKIYILK